MRKPEFHLPTFSLPTFGRRNKGPRQAPVARPQEQARSRRQRPSRQPRTRQTPRVVKSSYSGVSAALNAVGPFNSMLVLGVLFVFISATHNWHLMTRHGAVIGLAFAVAELVLFFLVIEAMHLSGTKPVMVLVAFALMLAMVVLVVGLVWHYPVNDWLTALVVFGAVAAMADPVGYANAKEVLHRRVVAFEAKEAAWEVQCAQELAALATITENANGMLGRATTADTKERLTREQVKEEVMQELAPKVQSFLNQALDMVRIRDEHLEATAELQTQSEQTGVTHAQALEQARREVQQEVSQMRETINRLELQQGRNPRGGQSEPAQPETVTGRVVEVPDGGWEDEG